MDKDNPPAFPPNAGWRDNEADFGGMSLRDYFAGQALANNSICTGKAPDWQLKQWFGDRCGIMAAEIAAAQANDYADAMLEARKAGSQ